VALSPAEPESTSPPPERPVHSSLGPVTRPTPADRLVALVEVILCSDYPTQILLGGLFAVAGIGPSVSGGELTLGYVMLLSFADTVLLLGLIVILLRARGESPIRLFVGERPASREARFGVFLVLPALGLAFLVLVLVQEFAPWLHTVALNPLEALIQSPRDAWLFASVVVVAGGVREEMQRAFLLHRFEGWLGGRTVGVVVTSVAFGAGHALQGLDAAFATGALGAFWAVIYLRRRSSVAPMVSHAGFNLLEIVQYLTLGR
jgi:membrane protease YdiL (CAAX protease family)